MSDLTEVEIDFINRLIVATNTDLMHWDQATDGYSCNHNDDTIVYSMGATCASILISASNNFHNTIRIVLDSDEQICADLTNAIMANFKRQYELRLKSIVFGDELLPTEGEDISHSILHVREYLKKTNKQIQ